MRIALVSYEFPPDTGKGGIGTYVKQLAFALAERGCDVHVFAGSSHRASDELIDGYWIHWLQCIDGNDFRDDVVKAFAAQHALAQFNLIESAEINANAWEIKKAFPQIPLVVRLHAPNSLVESLKKIYIPFAAKLRFVLGALRRMKWDAGYWRTYKRETDTDYQFIQLANAITAPSDAMKDWVVKYWQIPVEKIKVIPNIFIPPSDLLQIPVYETPRYKRIIFFGRLNVLKGLVNATRAMKKTLKEYPDWQFRVIGDDGPGPHISTTMRNWMKQKLAPVIKQVEFLEGMHYEALPNAIEPAEIVLLPSLFESFSYTCIEAMAAGKAVVGSSNGGMKDLIQDGNTGILTDPENYNDIYAGIKKIIDNNELRYRMSLNAREHVLRTFNQTAAIDLFIAFYKQIKERLN